MDNSHSVFVSLGDNNDSFNYEYKICALQNGVALLFAAFNMILNFLVLAIIHERVPRYDCNGNKTARLPDLSFDILPEAAWGLTVAECIITIQASIVFILLFIHRYRVILFRRLCLIMGVVYFARAIAMSSTQLPLIKDNYCSPRMPPDVRDHWGPYLSEIFRRVFHMMLGFGLSINGRHDYCGDFIFSGHTVTLTFCKYSLLIFINPCHKNILILKQNFNIPMSPLNSLSLPKRILDAKDNNPLNILGLISRNSIS